MAKRAEAVDYYRTHNRRLRDRDMIRSIFGSNRQLFWHIMRSFLAMPSHTDV